MTRINFLLDDTTLKKTSVTYLIFIFRLTFIFEFWLGEMQLIHISPFQTRKFVLMLLGCLVVSNRVRNWNKGKNFIFVLSILQICQLEIPKYIYKFISLNSLWIPVSCGFRVFNRVSWNKGKSIILVPSSFQIYQVILVSHSN